MRTIIDRGAQRIDKEEFTAFYEKHSSSDFRLCMSYLCNVHDSADAVQETFLRYLSADTEFRDEGHALGWLVMTAGNVCKDMLRNKKRHPREKLETACDIGSEENGYIRSEVFDAVCALPDKYKNVDFVFIDSMPLTPIGKVDYRALEKMAEEENNL